MEKEAHTDLPGLWSSRLIQVDITCPKDLLIAFLMRRNEKGNNEQTLLDITRRWYAGPELMEAIRLGYKLTHVYNYYKFDYFEVLYATFIKVCYEERKKHPSGALNLMPKFSMNSVSGKGAQHTMAMACLVLIGNEMYQHQKATLTHTRTISDDSGEPLACFVEEKKEVDMTPYSLNTTVWILSWSRVAMSRFTRLIEGYRCLFNCPIYGDTDSLFIRKATADKAPKELFGKELGQFKNEMPDSKIIGMIVLAPKTYMKIVISPKVERDGKCGDYYEKNGTLRKVPRLSYLAHKDGRKKKGGKPIPGEFELLIQVTCKGIPHYSKPYRANENYLVDEVKKAEILKVASRLTADQMSKSPKEIRQWDLVQLKDRYHVFTQPGKEPQVYAAFTIDTFRAVAEGKGCFTTVFGCMDRNLQQTSLDVMGITLDYNHRKLSAIPYWDKGGRLVNKEEFITYPLGYQHNCNRWQICSGVKLGNICTTKRCRTNHFSFLDPVRYGKCSTA